MNVRCGRMEGKPDAGISLLFSKSTTGKGSRYQQCILCLHIICTARDLGINLVYLEQELAIKILLYYIS